MDKESTALPGSKTRETRFNCAVNQEERVRESPKEDGQATRLYRQAVLGCEAEGPKGEEPKPERNPKVRTRKGGVDCFGIRFFALTGLAVAANTEGFDVFVGGIPVPNWLTLSSRK